MTSIFLGYFEICLKYAFGCIKVCVRYILGMLRSLFEEACCVLSNFGLFLLQYN